MNTDFNTPVTAPATGFEKKDVLALKINGLLKIIFKKWWLFGIAMILGGLGGFYYASLQKPVYQSSLTFALDNGSSDGNNLLSLASQFGVNVSDAKDIFDGDNILEIIKSRRMVEKVLLTSDSFNNKPYTLIEYYLQLNKKNIHPTDDDVHFPVGQPKESFSYRQDSILYVTFLQLVATSINAERPDRKLMIYEINVTSPNEKFTKVFTERLVSETNNFYIELTSKKSKKTLEVLEERVAAMKGNLNASIVSRASVQDANINPAFAASQVPVARQQANIQVYGGAYGEMFKNLELARFQYLKQIPLMQIIDDANYPMKKIKMSRLKTGLIAAFAAAFFTFFVLWLIRLFKK
ncbi:MAG: Wzz/FepE/Etk N-terminal domain-containing protein [Ferruginibacter sp.]